MIQFRANFFAETLGVSTSATVLLPQRTSGQIGLAGTVRQHTPVLYLLHGYSDDDTIWLRRTSIERYASDRGLAVVMPNAGTSFYCNEVYGRRYWDYVSQELPALVAEQFTVSDAREDTFVAGLSMGGYGAFKLALRQPDRFAAAGSLSGCLDMATSPRSPRPDETVSPVWGDRPIAGTDDDLVHLVGQADVASLPRMWMTCGTEDQLVEHNRTFEAAARSAGVDLVADYQPGTHEWGYWDRTIQQFLDFAMEA
ncbi:alpha/beta hydrolase family protein [Luteococcus sanguinis]|uniref:Alpha/beta hydrolase family protein n=1 Tax=Luteococcus sanguinis TaxID=174038 RepID=A0ABW1WYB5_9ACTN